MDTSAWSRAHHSSVREPWADALLADRLLLAPLVSFEILMTARDGASFDAIAERLSEWRSASLSASVVRAARGAMRTLAHRSSGAQRLPVIDYLVAAAAQEIGGAVLHYDRDYDTLAAIMAFESTWLAPPGSLA